MLRRWQRHHSKSEYQVSNTEKGRQSASVQRHRPLRNMPGHIGDDAPRWRLVCAAFACSVGGLLTRRYGRIGIMRIVAGRVGGIRPPYGFVVQGAGTPPRPPSPVAPRRSPLQPGDRFAHPTGHLNRTVRRRRGCPALPRGRRGARSRAAAGSAFAWRALRRQRRRCRTCAARHRPRARIRCRTARP